MPYCLPLHTSQLGPSLAPDPNRLLNVLCGFSITSRVGWPIPGIHSLISYVSFQQSYSRCFPCVRCFIHSLLKKFSSFRTWLSPQPHTWASCSHHRDLSWSFTLEGHNANIPCLLHIRSRAIIILNSSGLLHGVFSANVSGLLHECSTVITRLSTGSSVLTFQGPSLGVLRLSHRSLLVCCKGYSPW